MKNGKNNNKNKYNKSKNNKTKHKTININVQTIRSAPMATYNLTRGNWNFQNEFKLIALNDFITQYELPITTINERKYIQISIQMQENTSPLIIKLPGKRENLTITKPYKYIVKRNSQFILQINSIKPAMTILIIEIITIKPREAEENQESVQSQTVQEIEKEILSVNSNFEDEEEEEEEEKEEKESKISNSEDIIKIIKQNKYKQVQPDKVQIGSNYIVRKEDNKYYYVTLQQNTQIMWSYEIWKVPHALTNKFKLIDDNSSNSNSQFKQIVLA